MVYLQTLLVIGLGVVPSSVLPGGLAGLLALELRAAL